MMYQCNADEQYQKPEQDRWQRDIELEEKRRREHLVNCYKMAATTTTTIGIMTLTIDVMINITVHKTMSITLSIQLRTLCTSVRSLDIKMCYLLY